MLYTYAGVTVASTTTSTPTASTPAASTPTTLVTTNPAGVVITVGGNGGNAGIPGPRNDPADFYGIVLVILAIAVALVATRWIFGRGRRDPG